MGVSSNRHMDAFAQLLAVGPSAQTCLFVCLSASQAGWLAVWVAVFVVGDNISSVQNNNNNNNVCMFNIYNFFNFVLEHYCSIIASASQLVCGLLIP